jgi:hypothetical protein
VCDSCERAREVVDARLDCKPLCKGRMVETVESISLVPDLRF